MNEIMAPSAMDTHRPEKKTLRPFLTQEELDAFRDGVIAVLHEDISAMPLSGADYATKCTEILRRGIPQVAPGSDLADKVWGLADRMRLPPRLKNQIGREFIKDYQDTEE